MSSPQITLTATREDLAWAAGLFEGEGCFSLAHAKGVAQPTCVVSMSDEDVIRRLHRLLGIGSVRKTSRKAYGPDRKDLWTWTAAGFRSAQYVVALLWNWLGERRQTRAAEILRAGAATPARTKTHCLNGHDLRDEANTLVRSHITKSGRPSLTRHCRACVRLRYALRGLI